MEKDVKKIQESILELVSDLDNLFGDRIAEMHEVKGGQCERHAFCYYRSKVWDIRDKARKL